MEFEITIYISTPQKTKYLFILLDVYLSTNLNEENYKTLMKDIKEELNSQRDIPRLWTGILKIIKMSVLPNLI